MPHQIFSKNANYNRYEKAFDGTFKLLVKDVTESAEYADMNFTNTWLKKVLNYNVPFGKRARGKCVVNTYMLLKENDINQGDLKLACILGWCVEILQACCLVADDIMDGSEYRRGRLAWHKLDGLGSIAINDSFFLESIVYFLLKKYFSNLPCYIKLAEEFHDVTHKTLYGQNLDTLTSFHKKFDLYTFDHYRRIVKYKTSYYTFCLPVKLAMILGGDGNSCWESTREILLNIGEYFQVQDDCLDCFGDPKDSGKVGTDITESKCTWLFCKAKEVATLEEQQELLEAFESDNADKVDKVTQIYQNMNLPLLFNEYEAATYVSISQSIDLLEDKRFQQILKPILETLFRRKT